MRPYGLLLLFALSVAANVEAAETPPEAPPAETGAFATDPDTRADAAAFNASVSDADLIAWMRFMVQYDPVAAADMEDWSEAKLTARATEMRDAYTRMQMRLPRLGADRERETLTARMLGAQSVRLREARAQMSGFTPAQFSEVRAICQRLVGNARNKAGNPPEFDYLNPDLVRIHRGGCDIFLQKGIGQGYGIGVWRDGERWRVAIIDDYENWQRTEVPLPD